MPTVQELAAIVNRCIIRRTQALLSKYLPTKIEQVRRQKRTLPNGHVFICEMNVRQAALGCRFYSSQHFTKPW
jgi:hypothetical protein